MSADLNKMASAFNTSVAELEDELTSLILDGQISARIDSQNKVRSIFSLHFSGMFRLWRARSMHGDSEF